VFTGLCVCVSTAEENQPLRFLNLFAIFGVSIIGTNVLLHRYFAEKSLTMMRLIADNRAIKSIETLNFVLKWEFRILWLFIPCVIVCAPWLKLWKVANGMLIATFICVLVVDTMFTIIVTRIFLGPINDNLRACSGLTGLRKSAGFKHMQRTRRSTLFGACLVVFSSSLLYIDIVLWNTIGGPFLYNVWLNPSVGAAAIDCIANCVGVLFVSNILQPRLPSLKSTFSSSDAVPKRSFVIDSMAYSNE